MQLIAAICETALHLERREQDKETLCFPHGKLDARLCDMIR